MSQKGRAEEERAGEGVPQGADQGAETGLGPDQTPDGGGQVQDPGETIKPPYHHTTRRNTGTYSIQSTFWEVQNLESPQLMMCCHLQEC